jgi:hypothetical protein
LKSVFERSKSVFERLKSVFERLKSVFERSKSVFERLKSVFERLKSVFERLKSAKSGGNVVSGLPSGTEKWRISRFRHFHPPEISALRAVATTLFSGGMRTGYVVRPLL